MSRVVTEDDIFQILRDYERRIKELERAATGVIPNENQGFCCSDWLGPC
jgi:hypothetical protein